MPETLLRPADAAERLTIDIEGVLSLIRAGELAAVNVTRSGSKRPRWRISEADLEAFIARRRTTPRHAAAKRRRRLPAHVIEFF